jgi:predicted DNA-binding transcriptional regulator AlpA
MLQLKSEPTKAIPEALAQFSNLPNEVQLRLPIVKALLGISSASVWRLVAAKKLKTYKLTPRTTTFNCGELREFILAAKASA